MLRFILLTLFLQKYLRSTYVIHSPCFTLSTPVTELKITNMMKLSHMMNWRYIILSKRQFRFWTANTTFSRTHVFVHRFSLEVKKYWFPVHSFEVPTRSTRHSWCEALYHRCSALTPFWKTHVPLHFRSMERTTNFTCLGGLAHINADCHSV